MQIELDFVPPGGGEVETKTFVDLPAIPAAGDIIGIGRADGNCLSTYIVRRTNWLLAGGNFEVCVECEYAYHPLMSTYHRAACDEFAKAGKRPRWAA